MPKSCGPGQIRRASYDRKAHSRKSYRRGSTKVKGSYVDRTHVPSACVKDMGKPGKTPKSKRVLPRPGEKLHLSKYGYATHKAPSERHAALMKAAEKSGEPMLTVLRRLNLLANYQADPRAKAAMREDVDYMSAQYAKYKRSQGRTSSRKRSKSSRKGSKKSKGSKRSKRSQRRTSKKGSKKSKKRSKKGSRKH